MPPLDRIPYVHPAEIDAFLLSIYAAVQDPGEEPTVERAENWVAIEYHINREEIARALVAAKTVEKDPPATYWGKPECGGKSCLILSSSGPIPLKWESHGVDCPKRPGR